MKNSSNDKKVFIRKDQMCHKKYIFLTISFILGIYLIYIPALSCGFVNWDDEDLVFNPIIRSMDLNLFQWIFSAKANDTFGPLYFLTFAMDYAAWGLNPVGYHLTNIMLHSVNICLVFMLCLYVGKKMVVKAMSDDYCTKIQIVSLITSMLFGIHPMNVEAVTWIAARGGPLSGIFFFTSIFCYLKYGYNERHKRYLHLSLFFFTLAALSKPTTVTLPAILLIMDYAILNRVSFQEWQKDERIWRVFHEKIPFFIIGLLLMGATAWLRQSGGYVVETEVLPFYMRLSVAVRSIFFYLYKIILPFNLVPIYPYPSQINLLDLEYVGSFFLFLVITLFCVIYSKNKPVYLFLWLSYLVTLIPTILPLLGVYRMGLYAEADRYAYLPGTVAFLGSGLVAARYSDNFAKRKGYLSFFIMAGILITLSIRSIEQIGMWENSLRLWSHQIKISPSTFIAYNNRGIIHHRNANYTDALVDFSKAIDLYPRYTEAYSNRGNIHSILGNYVFAEKDFSTALKFDPQNARLYANRGLAYSHSGNLQAALSDYAAAITINPSNDMFYFNRGMALLAVGNVQEAFKDFSLAFKLNPNNSSAYNFRQEMIRRIGNPDIGVK